MNISSIFFWLSIVIVFIPLIIQLVLSLYATRKGTKLRITRILLYVLSAQVVLASISIELQRLSFVYSLKFSQKLGLSAPPPILSLFISFYLIVLMVLIWLYQKQKIEHRKENAAFKHQIKKII